MFSLIKFKQDDMYDVCKTSSLRNKNGIIQARFKKRGFFEVEVICTNDDEYLLKDCAARKLYITLRQPAKPKKPQKKSTSGVIFHQSPKRQLHQSPKRHCCCFCQKLVTKIAVHLENVHKEESEVKKFSCLPKGNTERKRIIDILRKEGDKIHNCNLKDSSTQKLILCRRPQKNKPRAANYYKICSNCKGFFSKENLRKHFRYCSKDHIKGVQNVMVLSRMVRGDIHSTACSTLKNKVFPVLRDDEVTQKIAHDHLIILYGNHHCNKYLKEHHYKMIRARLRLLGKFLIEACRLNPQIRDLESIFHPVHYNTIIEAVKNIAGLNAQTGHFKSANNASSLGTQLKLCGSLLTFKLIQDSAPAERRKEVDDIIHLLKLGFSQNINTAVMETCQIRKRAKRNVLPSLEDIKKYMDYLSRSMKKCYDELISKGFTFELWKKLASYTLASIQAFNRRRPGEIERVLIEDYKAYETLSKNCDVGFYNRLSHAERKKAQYYVRFEIRGKKGRNVPVLLNKLQVKCIEAIIEYRDSAKVDHKNPYIFGLPSKNNLTFKHLDAYNLMVKYSKLCGAENPNLLRGNNLRKHIATQSQLLDLNESEVQHLAQFMGHAEKIHKEHYQLPVVARDIANMSKLLEIAQGISCDDEGEDERKNDDCENRKNIFSSGIDEIGDLENPDSTQKSNLCFTDDNRLTYKKTKEKVRTPFPCIHSSWSTHSTSEKEVAGSSLQENLSYEMGGKGNNHRDQNENSFSSESNSINELEDADSIEEINCFLTDLDNNLTCKKTNKDIRTPLPSEHCSWSAPSEKEIKQSILQDENKSLPSTEHYGKVSSNFSGLSSSTSNQIKSRFQGKILQNEIIKLPNYEVNVLRKKGENKKSNKENTYSSGSDLEDPDYIQDNNCSSTDDSDKDLIHKKGKKKLRMPSSSGRNSWSTPEKQIVRSIFQDSIQTECLPSTDYCKKAISKESILSHRTSNQIKSWIQAEILRNKSGSSPCFQDNGISRIKRRSWKTPERKTARSVFKENIERSSLPSLEICEEAIATYPELAYRTSYQLKAWLQAEILRNNRKTI